MGVASDTYARLLRSQWQDYQQRFQPIEQALMQQTTWFNPALETESIADEQSAVSSQYNAQYGDNGSIAKGMQRYGLTVTPEMQQQIQREGAVNKAAAMVGAANTTRQRLADRNVEIALGSIPSSGRTYGLYSGSNSTSTS